MHQPLGNKPACNKFCCYFAKPQNFTCNNARIRCPWIVPDPVSFSIALNLNAVHTLFLSLLVSSGSTKSTHNCSHGDDKKWSKIQSRQEITIYEMLLITRRGKLLLTTGTSFLLRGWNVPCVCLLLWGLGSSWKEPDWTDSQEPTVSCGEAIDIADTSFIGCLQTWDPCRKA